MCPLKFSRTSDIQQAWNSTNLALEYWNSTTSVVPHNNSPVFSIPTSKKWNIKNLVVRISHTYSSSKDHLINISVTAFNFFSPQLITKSLPLVILIFYVCTALDKVFWRPTQISLCLSTRYKIKGSNPRPKKNLKKSPRFLPHEGRFSTGTSLGWDSCACSLRKLLG